MRALVVSMSFSVSLCSLALCSVSGARAQDVSAHPRRARAMFLYGEQPAVLVASDRAWMPDTSTETPLSICAGERCRPVRSIERCDVPRCPGVGRVMTTDGAIASVPDYPTSRDEFHRERDALYADAALAPLAGYLAGHPQPAPEPTRWQHNRRDRDPRWELSLAAGPSLLTHADLGTAEITLGGGARFLIDWGNDEDDDFLGIMLGSSLGVDLRAHVLPGIHGQAIDDFGFAIGVAPAMGMSPAGEILRLPTVLGTIIPEIGAIFRDGNDPALYMRWSAPIAFLLDEHVALEARASLTLVEDWAAGDEAEAILGLSLGIVLR